MQSNRSMPMLVLQVLFQPCVYGWKRGDKYLYIGKSRNGIGRLHWHHKIKLGDIQEGDVLDLWYPSDNRTIETIEVELIQLFQPALNVYSTIVPQRARKTPQRGIPKFPNQGKW